MLIRIIICLAVGYGCGCISTGYLIGKANHIDIRDYGSGNVGTTNALRTLGWKAGALTYLGDFLKAVLPILLIQNFIFSDLPEAKMLGLYTGLGVMLGHNYPFWLHFKGGKGIAVTTGVMAAFDPLIIPFFIVLFSGAVWFTKYVSVGSLCLAVFFPIWIVIRHPGDLHMLILGVIFMGFAFIRHKDNLKRLKNKTENKIGQKVKIEEKKEENG